MAVQRLSNSGRSGFSYKSLIAGITPLPSVPTIGAATVVDYQSVNVAFTAPGAYAGSTYTATSSPGGFTGTSATSPILVSGLSESTEYTFTVTATNATGTSGASASSSPVTTPAGDTGVMYPLGMVQVGSAGAANIEFTSIPSTYTHLQLRGIARDASALNDSYGAKLKINSDTGNNYASHYLLGNGSNVTVGSQGTSITPPNFIQTAGGGMSANIFSAIIIDFLDYKNTNKYKTIRVFTGVDANSTTGDAAGLQSVLWMNANAISTITITSDSGSNWGQHTQFALYGIKGA